MYLKSLEMQGFKSFATKTKLEFHNGVTGIVGPNGSGKSNVGDAVRWVLGEQSAKQLRGGSMTDVIFAGTENRKPLGYAYVAITLDNSDRKLNFDADEVEVSRKLYRSGESEYRLNGKMCRLKDIHELFYDTGIGKEGYSIIGQGQIDKILSGKPEDRRELFDEAAGIVKFKRRKAESQKKLADEQANLVRLNDILSEVTRQIGPLEKQAEKAGIYLKKRDQLRGDEIMMFQIDGKRFDDQEKDITEKKKIASDQLEAVTKKLDETKKEYDNVEVELASLDEKITKERDFSRDAAVEKQQNEGQKQVLYEQVKAAEQNSETILQRIRAIESELSDKDTQIAGENDEKESTENALKEADRARSEKDKAVADVQTEISTYQNEAQQGQSDIIRLLNDRTAIKERMQRYDTMLEQIEIRKSELSSKMLSLKEEKNNEEERLKNLEKEFSEAAATSADMQKKIDAANATVASCKQKLTDDNTRLETEQTSYHRESSRLESLRSIAENYEGYANSIRKVMEQKDSNLGIHGVVADLVRTDEKYETAIETAFGGSLQNIVTDNEATAKYLIEYLKRGHFGRATFLPLTAVRGDKVWDPGNVLREPGVLGKADDLVSFDPLYKGIITRLLGRTIVVDTIDNAISVSRKYHQSVRMVTLTGELLSPGGSMTGGSFKYKNNFLGRKRQIEELSASVEKRKKEIGLLQNDIEEVKKVRNAAREDLARDNDAMQQLSLNLNSAKVNYENGKKRVASLQSEYDAMQKERSEIEVQINEIQEKNHLIGDELSDSEKSEKELQEKIRDMTGKTDELQKKLTDAQEAQNRAMLDFSALQQKLSFIEEKISTHRDEIEKLKSERDGLQENIKAGKGESEARQRQIEELGQKIIGLEKSIKDSAEKTEALQKKKEELNASHHSFFEERDHLTGEKGDLEQEIFRLDSQLEKVRNARDDQIQNLYEQYQITPDDAEAVHFDNVQERSELKKEISTLKSEINALGAVNVNAVEEYKELKERYDFLTKQHDDLIKATDELNEIILQLDEGMRKQFQEKFAYIQKEYDKVFRELFGGGKGELQLVEGEDILESGIVIIAQPPGKKLQNMMQLSGGEKALTAIALLFAIQNLKPSPFCLLDEIEAALDDNNVGRFASYLHRLTDHTQFIVITHRRGTMAAADRLYGITMQEKGVSKIVSVDLIESQLDA